MRKYISLLFFFLLSSIVSFGQGWVHELTSPGQVVSGNIHATDDGNYIVTLSAKDGLGGGLPSGSYLAKIDESGAIIWLEKFSDASIQTSQIWEAPDGGYVAIVFQPVPATGVNEFYLLKLNSSFELEAEFHLDNFGSTFTDVLFTNDTEFVIGGAGLNEGKIRKYDLDLNILWETPTSNGVNDIKLTLDGNLIATSRTSNLFKLTLDGEILWENSFSSLLQSNYLDIHPMDDGSFMLFTVFEPQNNKRQLKVDADGQLIWVKDLMPASTFALFKEFAVVDDGYIFSGFIDSPNPAEGRNLFLLKSNFEGDVVWQKNIHVRESLGELCKDIVATPDGGVIGAVDFFGPSTAYTDRVYLFKVNDQGNLYDQQLDGKIVFDSTGNCSLSEASGLENWSISASNSDNTIFGTTDALGNYQLNIPTGIYTLTVHPPSNLWEVCENDITIGFVENAQLSRDFVVDALADCPQMAVQSVFPIVRPCFDNNIYYVSYCNEGTSPTSEATVEIIADASLSYVSATAPLIAQDENVYVFNIGDVGVGECGNFNVAFMLDCEADLGETICVSSEISPFDDCEFGSTPWQGAFVEAEVNCESDSIEFSIQNVGQQTMASSRQFIVIEDAIVLLQDDFQLEVGAELIEKFPANGSTLILEAMQEINAPGDELVKVWIEGCGTNQNGEFSTGFINQYSLGDNIPHKDRECRTATSAFDPNDKQGFPTGYGLENFITDNINLEYLIRFQNTGSDTAFTVILLDTIAAEMDLSTLRVGPASHDYQWEIRDGNVLKCTFNSIYLPDSTTNFDASNGFLKYTIKQQPDLPEGTVIKNDVGIYFDYNEVVMTNETFHTIGSEFIALSEQTPIIEAARIEVYPNPFDDFTIFKMNSYFTNIGSFELYDLSGQLILQQSFNGNEFIFRRNNLPDGNYFYKITDIKNGIINSGQLSIH